MSGVDRDTSDSAFDKLMLMACSQMWFTASRVEHFSPQSASDGDMQHMLEWAHLDPYIDSSQGAVTPSLSF